MEENKNAANRTNPAEVQKPAAEKAFRKKHIVREYAESIIIAALLALVIRTFVVQAFKIPSGSMEDTLAIGDHILVNKFIYGSKIPFTDKRLFKIRDPRRGDVDRLRISGRSEQGFHKKGSRHARRRSGRDKQEDVRQRQART